MGERAFDDAPARPLGEGDALLVIDMQCDFVPHDRASNPSGGRFGVAEGDHVVAPITRLIDAAVAGGATVVATRDYHPHDHTSFASEGGPFPSHCVQGTDGARFLPPIAASLTTAMREAGNERVLIAFKGRPQPLRWAPARTGR